VANVRQLLSRWEALKAERQVRDTLHQDLADYIDPFGSDLITRQQVEGSKQTSRIFDSTALHASSLLGASLHGTMTPSTQPWLSLAMRDEVLNDDKAVSDWLEECARRMHLALRQSNFNTAVHEMYLQLVVPATAPLFCEERPIGASGAFGGFRFQALSWGEHAIAEDPYGRVDTVFRITKVARRNVVSQWPTAPFPTGFLDTAKIKPDEQIEVLHAVSPRAQYDSTKRRSKDLPWASCYLLTTEKILLDEGGYHEFPYMVPRWTKKAGRTYGDGPSHLALPDIKTLNTAKEFLLKQAPLTMFPPTVERDDSVLGDVDLTPSGRNVVSGQGALSDMLAFLEPKGRMDMAQLVFGDLKQSIREMYFIPQLQLQDAPQMTATEVQVRWELMQRFLGPTVGRLEAEFLNPLVERCFGLMARAGALPPVPEALRGLGQMADIDIEYEGPLARAQRTIELTAQDRVLQFAMAIDAANPEAHTMDGLDLDAMLIDRATITGLPSKVMRGKEQIMALRQQRQQAQSQQQQVTQATEVAKSAGAAAPMITALHQASQVPTNGGRA
jgi:hypothetical protein